MTAPNVTVRILPDGEALGRAAAEAVAAALADAAARQDRVTLALAGGSTPRRLYELLAGPFRDALPWDRLHIFWGDERLVPPDDEASNYAMAREALLRHVPLPPGQIHPIPTDRPAAAAAYTATLRQTFGDEGPTFDLALLGLGDDGHTASLFPGGPLPDAPWAAAVTAPARYAVRDRITLTLPALCRARRVFFLVSGEEKRAALHRVLDDADPTLPATHVRARETVTWFVDQAAAG
ncbi:MAG: 6-phosphogluconolactonase [Rhodothermales bacterium]|nr:6-phosphogluconolactonase [Rhodothermales bacterium]